MQKIDTKDIEIYQSQADELEKQATNLSITSPEENAKAIEVKAKLSKLAKEIKNRKEEITKPLNTALRSIRALWAPLEDAVEMRENAVGRALLDYKSKVDAETRKKEAQIAARVEKGTMRLDTAEKKLDNLPKIQNTTHTTEGQVQFRKIPKMRIIDRDLVPDSYWIIDEVRLRQAVVSGIVVPGAELYFEERV